MNSKISKKEEIVSRKDKSIHVEKVIRRLKTKQAPFVEGQNIFYNFIKHMRH